VDQDFAAAGVIRHRRRLCWAMPLRANFGSSSGLSWFAGHRHGRWRSARYRSWGRFAVAVPDNRVKSGDDEWNKDRGQNRQNEYQDFDEAGHGFTHSLRGADQLQFGDLQCPVPVVQNTWALSETWL
jgi:hypothetical protein